MLSWQWCTRRSTYHFLSSYVQRWSGHGLTITLGNVQLIAYCSLEIKQTHLNTEEKLDLMWKKKKTLTSMENQYNPYSISQHYLNLQNLNLLLLNKKYCESTNLLIQNLSLFLDRALQLHITGITLHPFCNTGVEAGVTLLTSSL